MTGDGRTFSGLPMSFYVPEYKARESFENSYQLAPPVKFDGIVTVRTKLLLNFGLE